MEAGRKMNAQKRLPETPVTSLETIGWEWFLDQYWDEALYLALANSRNILAELSDGKVTLMMPTPAHQQVTGNLYAALREYGRAGNRGRAYMAPMPIRLWPGKFREPDVAFYKTEHLDRVGEQYGEVPDLVAEVISPSTHVVDRGAKREEYAQAGVPEYWLLDPETRTVTVYVLAEGKYRFAALYREGETARSETLEGLQVEVSDLFD